jgi:hypothetical protein
VIDDDAYRQASIHPIARSTSSASQLSNEVLSTSLEMRSAEKGGDELAGFVTNGHITASSQAKQNFLHAASFGKRA